MATKLRILQVHDLYKIRGGEEQVVEDERALLTSHGHQVFLYTRDNRELDNMGFLGKLCLPFTTIFSVKTYLEVRKEIKEKQVDILHVHNTLPLISPSVFFAAFFMKVPVVMTLHNFRLLCLNGIFYRDGHICEDCVKKGLCQGVLHGCYRGSRLMSLLCAASTKLHRILGTYDRISYICLTEFNKEKLLEAGIIHPKQVFVKPNFSERLEKAVTKEQRKDFVLYAGRLEKEKGIPLLFRAYRLAKEQNREMPRLLVCGEGSLDTACRRYIKKHELGGQITMMGRLSHEELMSKMGEAKAVILPSLWYEGFPLTILEAYEVKTPVICQDLGNVGNLVRNGVNGQKIRPGDIKGLAEAIADCNELSCSFDLPEAKLWEKEENYKKLIEIYERCIKDVSIFKNEK